MNDPEPKNVLGHLVSSSGHHIINAFSSIVSHGELLRTLENPTAADRAELNERIDTLIRTALEASVLTRKLIELGHEVTAVEGPHAQEPAANLALDRALPRWVDEWRQALGPQVQVSFSLAPVPRVVGQPEALRSMVSYLLDNAAESFEGGRGTIAIATKLDERSWVSLEVRDDGSGMRPEVIERAAEPFYTTKAGHRGIGLTVARGIWRRHRGTMTIESQPGKGTLIRLSIHACG